MLSSKEELLETLARIEGLPVLVVGDIILDRYVWGSVDRISPEAYQYQPARKVWRESSLSPS